MHRHSRLDPIAEDSHTSPGITCIHAQKNHTLILYYASDLRSRTQLLINTIQAGSDVRPRSYLIPGGRNPNCARLGAIGLRPLGSNWTAKATLLFP